MGLASDLRSVAPPQIEQARLDAELRRIEPRLTTAHAAIADHVRRLAGEAKAHLDAAFVLWRQHTEERARSTSSAWRDTRRMARNHVREAQWHRRCAYAASRNGEQFE